MDFNKEVQTDLHIVKKDNTTGLKAKCNKVYQNYNLIIKSSFFLFSFSGFLTFLYSITPNIWYKEYISCISNCSIIIFTILLSVLLISVAYLNKTSEKLLLLSSLLFFSQALILIFRKVDIYKNHVIFDIKINFNIPSMFLFVSFLLFLALFLKNVQKDSNWRNRILTIIGIFLTTFFIILFTDIGKAILNQVLNNV